MAILPWRNPPKINEPVPEGTALRRPTSLAPFCVLYRLLLQPQDAMARLAVVAARTLAVPALTQLWICRVGIWQYKMSQPFSRRTFPPSRRPLAPAFLVYTKTDFVDYMDRDDVT